MTSIDRNQPEKNHEDLSGAAAVERIKRTVHDSPNCFFCSRDPDKDRLSARPMNVRKVDDEGSLWFLAASDSCLIKQLEADNSVNLFFQGSKHAEFLQLDGVAMTTQDEHSIDELWEPILKTWFTEGPRDPRIVVIQVAPHRGHYWDQKHGGLVAGTKMMIGAMLGVTLDDSIQGELHP